MTSEHRRYHIRSGRRAAIKNGKRGEPAAKATRPFMTTFDSHPLSYGLFNTAGVSPGATRTPFWPNNFASRTTPINRPSVRIMRFPRPSNEPCFQVYSTFPGLFLFLMFSAAQGWSIRFSLAVLMVVGKILFIPFLHHQYKNLFHDSRAAATSRLRKYQL